MSDQAKQLIEECCRERVLDENALRFLLQHLPRSVKVTPEEVESFLELVDDGVTLVRAAAMSGIPVRLAGTVLDTASSLGLV